jgi:hypothetical protein
MDLARAEVKAQLLLERQQLRRWHGQMIYLCQCELCGRAYPTDLHESIISRGNVRGADALQAHILICKFNLNLLCNKPCNVDLAEVEMFRRFLISKNIARYGEDPILAWIESLPLKEPGPYLCLVRDVAAQMKVVNHEDPAKKKAREARALKKKLKEYGADAMF